MYRGKFIEINVNPSTKLEIFVDPFTDSKLCQTKHYVKMGSPIDPGNLVSLKFLQISDHCMTEGARKPYFLRSIIHIYTVVEGLAYPCETRYASGLSATFGVVLNECPHSIY